MIQGILGKAPRYMSKGIENAEKRSQSHKVRRDTKRKSHEESGCQIGRKGSYGEMLIMSLERNRRCGHKLAF